MEKEHQQLCSFAKVVRFLKVTKQFSVLIFEINVILCDVYNAYACVRDREDG